ncbi:MAG: NTP transferase domain-containing protein [Victivallales bacterium]|jgi:mannose-1-phosphate guanylyltransferase|nr:NTP transferase domain-containing protein [Victivallales bacterium]
MLKNVYAVVMAGGKGERFWPQSRIARPKQFLNLLGDITMIELTLDRLRPFLPVENILVITNQEYTEALRKLLPFLPAENVIGEPCMRDTAPCAALGAGIIRARGGDDAVMILLPADHLIERTCDFGSLLVDVATCACENPRWIYTIGVVPTEPATWYGYIRCGEEIKSAGETRLFKSLGFREKPDSATAETFLADGHYRWNCGIFLFQIQALQTEFKRQCPELSEMLEKTCEFEQSGELTGKLPDLYARQKKLSIDYAVMENALHVAVAECRFDWDDIGSWTALRNHLTSDDNGNVATGLFVGLDSRNLIVSGKSDHLVAAIGVEDLVIVETPDVTLICRTEQAQRIKELLATFNLRPELRQFL